MINPVLLMPGASMLLLFGIEVPHKVKRVIFKAPIWITSSVISLGIGFIGRGVIGPATGFATELILFPGLYLAKKHFQWKEEKIKVGKLDADGNKIKKKK